MTPATAVHRPAGRGSSELAGAAAALMARLDAIAAEQVAPGVLLDRILSLLEARRTALSSRDGRDELLLLLVAQMFSDDSVQVVDVMARAAVCPELQQALTSAGAVSGRRLGRWFLRVESRSFDDVHVVRIGRNGHGLIWRVF
ncbi:MAG TPA: hypothetical protein VE505_20660 [Vicinamibacterales bacterium]|nr:hypothetical protein [Vicinamibacterales bacterium]